MMNERLRRKHSIQDDPFYSRKVDMRTCEVCGKEFYIPCFSLWAYKRTYKRGNSEPRFTWFCSWHCLSKFEETEKEWTFGRWATQS